MIAGAVGGAAADECPVGAGRARRDGGHPHRDAPRARCRASVSWAATAFRSSCCRPIPVSALVVFEVMVRPLIRLSLGKRQPMRRVVQARTLSPITSVAGPQGLSAWAADARPGHRRVPGAGARRRAGRVVASAGDAGRGELSAWSSPARPNRSAPARSSTSRSWPSAADRLAADEHVAFQLHASGLAAAGRPAAGAGGVVRLRPVRLRDAAAVEPDPAGRPGAPGAVGTGDRRGLGCAACGFVVAARCVRGCGPRRARAGCCRM